jgi:5'-nucleotidase
MKPKILITNDDGLYSLGLRASYDALKDLGDVYVVAPMIQKSGVGRSISIMTPIRMHKVHVNGMEVYAVDGTPTDAVILGIYEVIGEIPDLIVSGINLGENLSTEAVTTSGTVCSALEGATQGSKAIAISLEMPDHEKFEIFPKEFDFSLAKRVLRKIARKVLKDGLPEGVDVLNVNIPSKAVDERIVVTRLARKLYKTRVEKRYDPRGREYYWIYGIEIEDAEEGTDIHALKSGYVSVTPISVDLTAEVDFKRLERWLNE